MNVTLHKIRQRYEDSAIGNPFRVTGEQLQLNCPEIRDGMRVAIAVGSRGIADIDVVTKTTVNYVKQQGGIPFIIPAMGSHGGATPEGQQRILADYGITENTAGAPVNATMEVVKLDSPSPFSVYMSKPAWEADGVIVINRVKPHTDYHGSYESGLAKMLVIGLGKHAQALEIHKFGIRGLKEYLPEAARTICATGKILAGIGLVENRNDKLCRIEVIPGDAIMEREPKLLAAAAENMPSLPVDDIDLLIVDNIGKNYSGTGLDTNVIGRIRIAGESEPERPRIQRIIVRDISPESHGNALGIGMADVITRKLFDRIDFASMYENAFTSTFLERVKIPFIAENDHQAVTVAVRSCGPIDTDKLRIIRIRNTLHLNELYLSESIYDEFVQSGHQFTYIRSGILLDGMAMPDF